MNLAPDKLRALVDVALQPERVIGRRPVWIVLSVPRLECKKCGSVRQAAVSFAPGQHSYTKRFARYVLELVRHMTMWDVAQHLGVSWDLVKELLKEALRRRFGRPRLKELRLLAIDEISIGHGQRYLTVVLDLETEAVVFVGNGKGAEALDPFWKRLKSARASKRWPSTGHRPTSKRSARTFQRLPWSSTTSTWSS